MTTTSQERVKYEYMWSQPTYRINSPGLNIAPAVWELWNHPVGSTLRDYGAGEGKALQWFRDRGAVATGVDLVKLHPLVTEACLWELPDDIGPTEYAFCADVMEHIPPEHVLEVLSAIRQRTTVSAAFQIATVPCTQGERHGLKLHLTVETSGWWEDRLSRSWDHVQRYPSDRHWRDLYICH